MDPNNNSEITRASILRQLAASFYDALLILAILLIASALTIPLTQSGIITPNSPLLSLYYLGVCFLYFAGLWVKGGKTLGMHVWHIRIKSFEGGKLTWNQALIRFLTGLPAWGILILGLIRASVPEKNQLNYFADWLIAINPVWLLIISILWLIADHRPNSWREKVSNTYVSYNK